MNKSTEGTTNNYVQPSRVEGLRYRLRLLGVNDPIGDSLTEEEYSRLLEQVRFLEAKRMNLELTKERAKRSTDTRFFYVIRISGSHFKTGIADDVPKRLRDYRCSNPGADVVDAWPCPHDVRQEKAAQRQMYSHPSCTHAGGETFMVHDEKAFIAELRRAFGESVTEDQEIHLPRPTKSYSATSILLALTPAAVLLIVALVLLLHYL